MSNPTETLEAIAAIVTFIENEIPKVIEQGFDLPRDYTEGHWKEWRLDDISVNVNLHDDYNRYRYEFQNGDPIMTTEDIQDYFVGGVANHNPKKKNDLIREIVNVALENLYRRNEIFMNDRGHWKIGPEPKANVE